MTYFHACVGCQFKAPDCAHLAGIKTALAGYGATSVRHKCTFREATYQPGEAVEVKTFPDYETGSGHDEDSSPKCWFPAHFIEQRGANALCFIKKDAPAVDDEEWTFTPQKSSGFVKVTLARVRKRTTQAEDAILNHCNACGAYLPVEECSHEDSPTWRPVGCKTRPDLSANPGYGK